MPGPLKNARHERFAQELAKGKSQVDAYEAAGYRPHDSAAARLFGNVRVAARLDELKVRAAEKAVITAADIAQQLDEDREFARDLKQAAAAVSASTAKQREANRLLGSPVRNIMLRGGSRRERRSSSPRALVQRAINAPGSRHAVFRFRFNHVKTSVWSDTLPKVLKLCFPEFRRASTRRTFTSSCPGVANLDRRPRRQGAGREGARPGVCTALLQREQPDPVDFDRDGDVAPRAEGRARAGHRSSDGAHAPALKAYFDCNPPSKLHWSYQLFKAALKPGTKERWPIPATMPRC
jgi:hypothetical protein